VSFSYVIVVVIVVADMLDMRMRQSQHGVLWRKWTVEMPTAVFCGDVSASEQIH